MRFPRSGPIFIATMALSPWIATVRDGRCVPLIEATVFAAQLTCSSQDTFHAIARKIGLDFDQIPQTRGWLQEAGFVDVEQVDRLIPVGTWPKNRQLKEIGKYYQVHLLESGR